MNFSEENNGENSLLSYLENEEKENTKGNKTSEQQTSSSTIVFSSSKESENIDDLTRFDTQSVTVKKQSQKAQEQAKRIAELRVSKNEEEEKNNKQIIQQLKATEIPSKKKKDEQSDTPQDKDNTENTDKLEMKVVNESVTITSNEDFSNLPENNAKIGKDKSITVNKSLEVEGSNKPKGETKVTPNNTQPKDKPKVDNSIKLGNNQATEIDVSNVKPLPKEENKPKEDSPYTNNSQVAPPTSKNLLFEKKVAHKEIKKEEKQKENPQAPKNALERLLSQDSKQYKNVSNYKPDFWFDD